MGSASTLADLAAVGAGMAIVIAVVALLTSAEVAKRLQALVDQKLQEADVKLAEALNQQDKRITTLRQIMSQQAEDHETSIREMKQDMKEIKECISLMRDALDRMDRREQRDDDDRFPPRKVSNG